MDKVIKLSDLKMGLGIKKEPFFSGTNNPYNNLYNMMSQLETKEPPKSINKLDMKNFSFKERVLQRLMTNPKDLIGPAKITKTFKFHSNTLSS